MFKCVCWCGALFSESAHLEPNTSSHVSHHCTLDVLDWREGTRISPSRLPVVLHPCPSNPPPLLAGISFEFKCKCRWLNAIFDFKCKCGYLRSFRLWNIIFPSVESKIILIRSSWKVSRWKCENNSQGKQKSFFFHKPVKIWDWFIFPYKVFFKLNFSYKM